MQHSDTFNWLDYITTYEDLRKAGINTKQKAYQHWLVFGKKEGRRAYFNGNQPTFNLNNNNIIDDNFQYNFLELFPRIKAYVFQNDLQDRIFYTGKVSFDIYNEIICACDLGLQIRPGNGGALSGSVVDCLSVDIPVITVKDLADSLDIDHPMLISFDLYKYNDWVSIREFCGGYSDKLTLDISNTIIKSFFRKPDINDNNLISTLINNRLNEYALNLIDILSINSNDRIAFVTPYPPEFTGVADFTHSTIEELRKYIPNIDIFTDADIKGDNIYKMDQIVDHVDNYKKVIYVVGNSDFHTKIIMYLNKLGGACILHDERLCHLYSYLNKLPPNFIVDDEKGHTSPYFDEIIHADPLIVHSKKLQTIIKNIYNKEAKYLPFCSFNKLQKYSPEKIKTIKKKYNINGDINIVVNGRVKYPFQAVKLAQHFKDKNILCKIFFVGPTI